MASSDAAGFLEGAEAIFNAQSGAHPCSSYTSNVFNLLVNNFKLGHVAT